jgi:poly-beta-1,6-N-acetyl-D-glucosamine synthase
MIWIVIITGAFYVLLIAFFFYGWEKLTVFKPSSRENTISISVIVVMRNEEYSIAALLQDLAAQDYPSGLLEVLVVDDHSSDRSYSIASNFGNSMFRILSLPDGLFGKKAGIRHAMAVSGGALIVTTDADSRIGGYWLKSLAEYYELNKPFLILAPVVACRPEGVWAKVLALELYSLLGSTAGSASVGYPVMSNGANMAVSREILPLIEGIYDNLEVHSGDDMFVLLKLKETHAEKIHYLKAIEATVFTSVAKDLSSFVRQRKRWAAKARFYNDWSVVGVAILVLWVNLLLLITLVVGFIQWNLWLFLILFGIKSAIDFFFLFRVTSFFGERRLMRWFLLVQSFYFLYISFTALSGLFFQTTWKERTIKQ